MTTLEHEQELLATIAADLRAEGYDVYMKPMRQQLPPALADIHPDAVAFGASRNLVIHVSTSSAESSARLESLRSRLNGVPGWELRVFYLRPAEGTKHVLPSLECEITTSLESVTRLAGAGFAGPALLMSWATLEAIARKQLPSIFARPQTPERLIEVLAGRGDITPTEADGLRRLAEKRNRLVHGDLNVQIGPSEVAEFVRVLELLLKSQPSASPQPPNEL